MARPRNTRNRRLPENLYRDADGYFSYRHPVTKKRYGFGRVESEAITAAKSLNIKLLKNSDLVTRVMGITTVTQVITRFENERLVDLQYAERTLSEVKIRLNVLRREFGDRSWHELTLELLSQWLNTRTVDAYIKYRITLIDLFKFARAVGICEQNIAEVLLPKPAPKRKRERLTYEHVQQILAAAPPWLKIAIELAILTGQRREDLVLLRFDNIENGRLLLTQIKTGVDIAIKMGPMLTEVINRARESGIDCPLIIHQRPQRKVRSVKRTHWAAVTPDFLTDNFSKVRDSLELFQNWPTEKRPTFHELRSYAAHTYRALGYSTHFIQSLLGHKSLGMTEKYLSGHAKIYSEAEAI